MKDEVRLYVAQDRLHQLRVAYVAEPMAHPPLQVQCLEQ